MARSKLKIALVHDYLKEYGGAESVLENLSDIFPDAPIYTSLYRPSFFGPHRSRLEKKWQGRIHQSFFNLIPFAHKLLSPLRFLSPLAFRAFDFSDYDLIICSATGSFFPNSLRKGKAKLICYCHTPPRYLYGLATARSLDSLFYRLVNIPLQITLHYYRLFDFIFAQNVDTFIANSRTTAARIQKFYRRESVVVNPPVSLPSKLPDTRRSNFFVTGGRLARAKRNDLAVAACSRLGLPLKIFGRDFAGYESELRRLAGPNIEFLGEITDQEKQKLLSQAQAFLFCSDNEDFGIAPVEAMACGTPVIAYRSGGVTETVLEGQTGLFFDKPTVESLSAALKKFDQTKFNPQTCNARAQEFSLDHFVEKIRTLVSQTVSNKAAHQPHPLPVN